VFVWQKPRYGYGLRGVLERDFLDDVSFGMLYSLAGICVRIAGPSFCICGWYFRLEHDSVVSVKVRVRHIIPVNARSRSQVTDSVVIGSSRRVDRSILILFDRAVLES
jgi:hypothetical protein